MSLIDLLRALGRDTRSVGVEKRAAIAGVLRLVPTSPTESGVGGGVPEADVKTAG